MNISTILCLICIIGVCVSQAQIFVYYQKMIMSRIHIRRNLKKYTRYEEFYSSGVIGKNVRLLIEGTNMKSYFKTPSSLYLLSSFLGFGVFLVVLFIEDFGFAFLCGIFAFFLPYVLLISRLRNMRSLRSKEGNQVVTEILIYYRICDYNILEAIKEAAANIEDAQISKILLYNLAKGLQSSVTRTEVLRHLKIFRYSINTTWSNILATNIFFAHMYGIRIDSALVDLSTSILKGQKILQHSIRENNEAKLILRFLTPVTYLLSVFGACRFFGFTLGKYIKYQFFTALGFRWFLIMIMIYISSLIINVFISKEKMDI